MELRDQLQEALGGAYTLERELSGGGMSRVFVAQETALGRSVVIKVLAAELTGGVNIDHFELWKKADPHLQPRVVEVRRRRARLGGIEGR